MAEPHGGWNTDWNQRAESDFLTAICLYGNLRPTATRPWGVMNQWPVVTGEMRRRGHDFSRDSMVRRWRDLREQLENRPPLPTERPDMSIEELIASRWRLNIPGVTDDLEPPPPPVPFHQNPADYRDKPPTRHTIPSSRTYMRKRRLQRDYEDIVGEDDDGEDLHSVAPGGAGNPVAGPGAAVPPPEPSPLDNADYNRRMASDFFDMNGDQRIGADYMSRVVHAGLERVQIQGGYDPATLAMVENELNTAANNFRAAEHEIAVRQNNPFSPGGSNGGGAELAPANYNSPQPSNPFSPSAFNIASPPNNAASPGTVANYAPVGAGPFTNWTPGNFGSPFPAQQTPQQLQQSPGQPNNSNGGNPPGGNAYSTMITAPGANGNGTMVNINGSWVWMTPMDSRFHGRGFGN
ncbi:uncharacterized protein JN550_013704 [Neoarthrinium moseri]|uniref:uncharacterized protein n=1 Tax=Neoarthrinium moseri TaxID=1658444 RepID=UPI001FDCA1F3|nr:uncharacterized protein JN550_013704 [Neoarthrinium moseri]KAI1856686.1 hypothetical protein JN550_013704 [Neoarthrinium moseri]